MNTFTHEIVFLPGTLCNANIFNKQVDALRSHGFVCTVIDFGLASSLDEMLACVLAQSKQARFSLVAFSMGGMVAFELLRQMPDKITALILVASNAHADAPEKARARQQQLQQAKDTGLAHLIKQTYLPLYLYYHKIEHQQIITAMALQLGIDVFEAQLKVLASRPDSSEVLRHSICPVLIIGAEHDSLCSVSEQQRMHALAKHSELKIIRQCGHFISLEHPLILSSYIKNWIK